MCGIAGVMTLDGAPPRGADLEALTRALRHRGPDGDGRHVSGGVGLIQTRLAIIDLKTGDQPLYAKPDNGGDGNRCALVANGEIYNYIELRHQLGLDLFATESDCEPPLYLYLRHGRDFTRYLRGMYAIAIHDPKRERLVLARDPFGIKPLYYAETPNGFAFASEPQALLAAGLVNPSLRREALYALLQLQFTCGPESIFEGIERVLPGETITIEKGRIIDRWRLPALPEGAPKEIGIDAALNRLDETLNHSVGLHQRSDVPYGMFLSGGVDSSVVLAMMNRLNVERVHAFTVGFPGQSVHDERHHARVVARAAGAKHTEVEFTGADFWNLLPRAAAAMDDPAADYAILPTFKLAQAAQEAGLKVILTGEGGDELFAGYGRYRRAGRWRVFGGRRMRHRGILEGLGVLRDEAASAGWRDGIVNAEKEAAGSGRTPLQIAQATDCADWLAHDLLTKLDRCLMAFGVEGRVPFLDREMADYAFLLPDHLKVKHRFGKWVLRKWLETGLPDAKPFARKRGFTVPVGAWIAEGAARIAPLVARQQGIEEICNPAAVETLFKNAASGTGGRAGKAAWVLLFYALWHQAHVVGRKSAGDAFEALS
ncbi:MAG: asparagine synthase (glutamine-hydrolyzing) [Rhodospirillales bacterium]